MSTSRRTRARRRRTVSARPTPPYRLNADAPPTDAAAMSRTLWHKPTTVGSMTTGARSVEQFYVPEGSVTVLRCECCGGRAEYVADYASMTSDAVELRAAACFVAHLRSFTAKHEHCPKRPLQHQLDADVLALADALVAKAGQIFRAGGRVEEAAYVLTTGGVVASRFPDACDTGTTETEDDDMRVAVAERLWKLRDVIRGSALEARAVLHIGECSVSLVPRATSGATSPQTESDTYQALAVTVTTPMSGHLLLAPITPHPSSDGAPALLGAGEWHILQQSAPPVDGVLAVPIMTQADDQPLSPHPHHANAWMGIRTGPDSFIH